MEAIAVHYKLSEKEYLDAARLMTFPQHREWKRRAWMACTLFPFAFFTLGVSAGLGTLPAFGIACALLPLLIYLYFFRFNVVVRRFYRGDRKFSEAMTITFTDEHITMQSELIESKHSWKLYTDVLEGETCYVLLYGKDIRTVIILPKRVFRSKQQHIAFRELVGAQFARALPVQEFGELEETEREYQPASLEPPDWR